MFNRIVELNRQLDEVCEEKGCLLQKQSRQGSLSKQERDRLDRLQLKEGLLESKVSLEYSLFDGLKEPRPD